MKYAFVFAGQGAQTVGMGRSLYDNDASARAVFDEADKVLGWKVTGVCFNGPAEKLTESNFCQPAIYAMSLACLAAFRNRFPEIEPVAVAGLSLGEYSALAAAKAMSFADGLNTVAKRGALMDASCRKTTGGMASVLGGDPAVIADVCKEVGIDVANYNCPGQIVISGPAELVDKAAAAIREKGARKVVPLKVAGAFHSRLMKEAGEGLKSVLADVKIEKPSVPTAQNFVGTLVSDPSQIRENLVSQVAGSVRMEQCLKAIAEKYAPDAFIEFGPGSVVSGLVKRTVPEVKLFNVASFEDLDKINAATAN